MAGSSALVIMKANYHEMNTRALRVAAWFLYRAIFHGINQGPGLSWMRPFDFTSTRFSEGSVSILARKEIVWQFSHAQKERTNLARSVASGMQGQGSILEPRNNVATCYIVARQSSD